MSSASITTPTTDTTASILPEKKLKPCCTCPETKKARDTW
jgi:hypothetical protein